MIKGGERMAYESEITFKLNSMYVSMKFRNKNTDGKFVTQPEYDRLIRLKKLKKILK